MERIVVTGIGTVSPLGVGVAALREALCAGRSGIRELTAFDCSRYRTRRAGVVAAFEPRDLIPWATLRRLDRSNALAVAAARLALRDAGLDPIPAAFDRDALAVIAGTGGAGIQTTGDFFRVLCEKGAAAANPMLFPNTVSNASAGHVAVALGAAGPNTTFAMQGAAGEAAIGYAADLLRLGRARAALAGGVDELSPYLFHAYARFRALSPSGGGDCALRPFDRRRNGTLLAEGATLLLLETASGAAARGARVYAEVRAPFASGAAESPIAGYPRGGDECAQELAAALDAWGVSAREIGWVNASANGTRALDAVEAEAVARVLGAGRPVSSLKGLSGNGMAIGGLRAAASCLAVAEGLVPATGGLEEEDPALPALDHVKGAARALSPLRAVLQTGFAESGGDTHLLFTRPPGEGA